MKKQLSKFFVFIALLSIIPTQIVHAHPADLYAHTITINISKTELHIEWQIKPGPLLINFIWNQMDEDKNGSISDDEADKWSASYLDLLTATLNGASLPLRVDSVHLPSSLDTFQAGTEFPVLDFSAKLGQDSSQQLVIQNNMEPAKSINWFYVNAAEGTDFLFPKQQSQILTIDLISDPSQVQDQSQLLISWDSGAPALPFGQKKDVVTQTAEQVVPELAKRTPQDMLLDLVSTKDISLTFYIFALILSLGLGALHALTPGHGKTVVAAYLVGSRGTSWHAATLGTVVTLTHTGSVFLFGIFTLAASQYILPTTALPFLEILSGVLILGLGLYLLRQRFLQWQDSRKLNPKSDRKLSLTPSSSRKLSGAIKIEKAPANMHHHGDGKMHSHDVPESITWKSLIALGVSGGLVPCPDAIAILLVAVAINRILFGLALIVSFSLGLAVVLIVIGLLMVNSRRLFDRMSLLDRFAPVLPIVSASIVVILGAALTWGAVVKAKGNVDGGQTAQTSANEARILYLQESEEQVKQLFITDDAKDTSRLVSEQNQNVVEFTVSPNETLAAYLVQNSNVSGEIWLLDLKSMERKKISECKDAICSGLVWSPNSERIVYEDMSLENNGSGLPTLWWVDAATGEAQSVFQDSQIPGGNPRWSPDSKWLSYATPEGIRLYNLENGETRVIPNLLGGAAMWAPDSKTILLRDVVIRNDQFVTQLFLYDLANETTVNISPDERYENTLAVWSPDGTSIAVVRRDLSIPRGDQVWLMNADGSNTRQLTNDTDALHGTLDWSQDGKYLLYDLYSLASFPLDSSLQLIDVGTGKVKDLKIKGFNPEWAGK